MKAHHRYTCHPLFHVKGGGQSTLHLGIWSLGRA